MCIWHNSTYELDTFAPSLLHPLAAFEIFIHSLAAYVIIFKTPATMGAVKRSMFTLHLFGAYLDLFFSVLSTQYLLVPAPAGYGTGVLTNLGIHMRWQEYLLFSGFAMTGNSVLGFFECRYNAIVRGDSGSLFTNKKRLLYIGVHVIFAFTFILPITFNPPDQELGKAYVRRLLPCLPESVLNHYNFYVFAMDITLIAWLLAVPTLIYPIQCMFLAFRIAIHLSSTKAKSKKTHKLQQQFFIALCIQVSIPFMILNVPVFYNVYALANGYFNQAMNNITINIISLHGLFTSIVMLIVHKPYCQAVTDMFCGPCSRVLILKSSFNSITVQATVFSSGLR